MKLMKMKPMTKDLEHSKNEIYKKSHFIEKLYGTLGIIRCWDYGIMKTLNIFNFYLLGGGVKFICNIKSYYLMKIFVLDTVILFLKNV